MLSGNWSRPVRAVTWRGASDEVGLESSARDRSGKAVPEGQAPEIGKDKVSERVLAPPSGWETHGSAGIVT